MKKNIDALLLRKAKDMQRWSRSVAESKELTDREIEELKTDARDNNWHSVTWWHELSLFVAVAESRKRSRMTSSNGISWTARSAALRARWQSIAWSPALGLFVAVASREKSNIMTSSDGKNWDIHKAPVGDWEMIAWDAELGLFIAIASNVFFSIMTSSDGVNWIEEERQRD